MAVTRWHMQERMILITVVIITILPLVGRILVTKDSQRQEAEG